MKAVYSLLLTAAFAVPSLAQPGPGGRGGFGGPGQGGPGQGQGQEIERLRDQVRQLEEKLKHSQQPQGDRKPEFRKDEPKKPEGKPDFRKDEPKKPEGKQPEFKKPEGPKGEPQKGPPQKGEPQKGETFQLRLQGPGPGGQGGGQPNVMWLQAGPGAGVPGINKLTPEEQMILKTLLAKASGMSQGQPGQPQTRQLNPQPLPPKQGEARPQGGGQPNPQARGPQGSGEQRRGPGGGFGPGGPGFGRGGDGPRGGGDRPQGGGEKKSSVEERLDRLEKMIQELARSQQRR